MNDGNWKIVYSISKIKVIVHSPKNKTTIIRSSTITIAEVMLKKVRLFNGHWVSCTTVYIATNTLEHSILLMKEPANV